MDTNTQQGPTGAEKSKGYALIEFLSKDLGPFAITSMLYGYLSGAGEKAHVPGFNSKENNDIRERLKSLWPQLTEEEKIAVRGAKFLPSNVKELQP